MSRVEDVAVDGLEDERADDVTADDVFGSGDEAERGVCSEEGSEGFASLTRVGGVGGCGRGEDGGEELGEVEMESGGDSGDALSGRVSVRTRNARERRGETYGSQGANERHIAGLLD